MSSGWEKQPTQHDEFSRILPPTWTDTLHPSKKPMNLQSFTTSLRCILIDDQRNAITAPFRVTVPLDDDCRLIVAQLRIAVPLLRARNASEITLHQPLTPISFGPQLTATALNEAQVNIESRVRMDALVGRIFQQVQVSEDNNAVIDTIICVRNLGAGQVIVRARQAGGGIHSFVTIKLKPEDDIQQPRSALLFENFISETSDQPPDFVRQFDDQLLRRRSDNIVMDPLVKELVVKHLGVRYNEYFGDPADDTAHFLEFIHYCVILLDNQVVSSQAYMANKESHMFALLNRLSELFVRDDTVMVNFNKSWPFPLILETHQDGYQHRLYTPRSDFSIIVSDFPVLILEVNSGQTECDRDRMILQAACLVRMGNALLTTVSLDYIVKAIYFGPGYHATEYTLFQRDIGPNDVVTEVEYTSRVFDLSERDQLFKFIFRLYNFVHSMRKLRGKLSDGFHIVKVLCGSEHEGSSSSSTRSGSGHLPTRLFRGRHLSLIEKNGYKLLPDGQRTSKPILKVAKGKDVFALKVLHTSSELKTLKYLQSLKADKNHVIELLHIMDSDDAVIIAMPWQSELNTVLAGSPDAVSPLRRQFLEGVSFLHEHGIAHLDLKPENTLVDFADSSLPPRLTLIDFGISINTREKGEMVAGYRGTPSWTAPEVGWEGGPRMTYNAIQADRWASGQMLLHITKAGSVSITEYGEVEDICQPLLNLDPSKRPKLDVVLQTLSVVIGTANLKRVGDELGSWMGNVRGRSGLVS